MIKYLLFSITAAVALCYLYVFQIIPAFGCTRPIFELFAPVLFAVAGLFFLNKRNQTGAVIALLALGIMAKETLGLWSILPLLNQTNYTTGILAFLIAIAIVYCSLLAVAVYSMVSPAPERYGTLERIADKPIVKITSWLPLLVITGIISWWIIAAVLKTIE